MMMSVIWVAAIIGIFAVLKRKREQLRKVDEIGI
jgi:predicted membrane channel-forming protein YqfA (hemolysin III family)